MNSEIKDIKEEIANRIRECARIAGSGDKLARSSGVPRRTLENYLSGKSEPKPSSLAAIAVATGVSLDWLILGRGPVDWGVAPVMGGGIDPVRWEEATIRLVDAIEAAGSSPAPRKFVEMQVMAYRLMDKIKEKEAQAAALEAMAKSAS